MTPIPAVVVASVIGAALFLAAGFLLAKLRAAPDGPLPQHFPGPAAPQSDEELSALRKQLGAAQAKIKQLGEESSTHAKAKAALESQVQQLSHQEKALKAQAAKAQAERDEARSAGAAKSETEEEVTQVQSVPRSMQDKIINLEKDLEQARSSKQKAETQLTAIQSQLEEQKKQIQQAQAQKASLQKTVTELQKQVPQGGQLQPNKTIPMGGLAMSQTAEETKALNELLAARNREAEESLKTERTLREQVAQLQTEINKVQTAAKQAKTQQMSAPDPSLIKEIKDLKARLAAGDNQLAGLNQLESEKVELKQQVAELKKLLDERKGLETVVQEKHDLVMKVESLKQTEAEAERLRNEKVKLAEKLKDAEDKAAELYKLKDADQERQDLSIKVQVLEKQLNELERLRNEQIELKDRLKDAENRAEDLKDLQSVDKDRQDLAIKVQVLGKQLEELERVRDENTKLKSSASDIKNLQNRLAEMEAENANLRSQVLVQKVPNKSAMKEKSESRSTDSLQSILDEISITHKSHGTVLADEMGLLVAGSGDHTEALAAVAALMSDTGGRAKVLLPLAGINKMELVDENTLTVTAQPFQTGVGRIIFATLTAGSGLEKEALQKIINSTAAVLK